MSVIFIALDSYFLAPPNRRTWEIYRTESLISPGHSLKSPMPNMAIKEGAELDEVQCCIGCMPACLSVCLLR